MKKINSKAKVLLTILIAMLLFSACTANIGGENTPAPSATVTPTQSGLIGFIVFESQKINEYMAMHGFLETAETISKTAKLYRFNTQEEMLNQTQKAIDDSCDGVILDCSIYDYSQAVQILKDAEVPFVTLFNKSADDNINVYINNTNHYADIALVFAENIKEAGHEKGKILIYSDKDCTEVLNSFNSELTAYDFPFNTVCFEKKAEDSTAAKTELQEFLNQNPDVYAIYATNSSLTRLAMQTVEKAKATENIFVIGTSLTDTTIKLFESGLFGLCINPVNESAVVATHMLNDLINGQAVEDKVLSWHIAFSDTINKYAYIRDSAKELFGG
ncbi:MAG: sugar ABC transporter substrate-binding protein [Clostridiales bacterium]|jgi:ABC-type sugar transport system substrate-binding protein|nr:sugar ABC transporter substrate-binding protein [Clostridiales bacterium]